MIHDPHCPAPEMCSECWEFVTDDSHDCGPDYSVSPWIYGSALFILVTMTGYLAWVIWNGLKYNGWIQ